MKNVKTLCCACTLTLLFACTQSQNKVDTSADTSFNTADTSLSKTENADHVDTMVVSFFKRAAYNSMVVLESSSKMVQSTKHKGLALLAGTLVKDHTTANKTLKNLAISKGYNIPAILPEAQLQMVKKMDQYKDEARNEYYTQLMIQQYINNIGLYTEASRLHDAAIAKFASQQLPLFDQHYQKFLKIDTALKAAKANQGDDPIGISNGKKP